MHYVPIEQLQANMILANTLFNIDSSILLIKGTELTNSNINNILELKYSGVYIEDNITDFILKYDTTEVKNYAINYSKNFILLSNNNTIKTNLQNIHQKLFKVLNSILDVNDVINVLSDLKFNNIYTYEHSINVAIISIIVGNKMNLNLHQLIQLSMSAILHDIGKQFISNEIINKPSKLTKNEYKIIQNHTLLGYHFLQNSLTISSDTQAGVLQHHENYDGSGYPLNYKETDINIFARIIHIVDVFDALISRRSYHESFHSTDVLNYIKSNSGTMFDPEIVYIFLKLITI